MSIVTYLHDLQVGRKYRWLKIVPPKGSYCWISRDYVEVSADSPSAGVVTGDNVAVYAGADHILPLHSRQRVTLLDEGYTVKLLGIEKGSYYKIVPPQDAYYYISEQYLKWVAPITRPKIVVPVAKKAPAAAKEPAIEEVKEPAVKVDLGPVPSEPKVATVKKVEETEIVKKTGVPAVNPVVLVKPKEVPNEVKRLEEYYVLESQVNTELAKELSAQDYSEIKKGLVAIEEDKKAGKACLYAEYQLDRIDMTCRKGLVAIEEDKKAGKACLYAEYQLDRIDNYELAGQVEKALAEQKVELSRAREDIKKKLSKALMGVPDAGKYVITGILKKSHIYTGQGITPLRYLVMDVDGDFSCYAVAADGVMIDAARYVGKKVGLTGKAVSDPYNPVGIVEFTAITDIEEKQAEGENNSN